MTQRFAQCPACGLIMKSRIRDDSTRRFCGGVQHIGPAVWISGTDKRQPTRYWNVDLLTPWGDCDHGAAHPDRLRDDVITAGRTSLSQAEFREIVDLARQVVEGGPRPQRVPWSDREVLRLARFIVDLTGAVPTDQEPKTP